MGYLNKCVVMSLTAAFLGSTDQAEVFSSSPHSRDHQGSNILLLFPSTRDHASTLMFSMTASMVHMSRNMALHCSTMEPCQLTQQKHFTPQEKPHSPTVGHRHTRGQAQTL